jgi:hypothetical protein
MSTIYNRHVCNTCFFQEPRYPCGFTPTPVSKVEIDVVGRDLVQSLSAMPQYLGSWERTTWASSNFQIPRHLSFEARGP